MEERARCASAGMVISVLAGLRVPAALLLTAIGGPGYFDPQATSNHPFVDITGHWAVEWIMQPREVWVNSGYPDRTFRPDGSISSSEIRVVLLRALNSSVP
jgi:hypothetical protein